MLPTEATPWQFLLTVVLVGYLLAGLGTWPVCWVVLHLYRRRIARGMRPALPTKPGSGGRQPPTADDRAVSHRHIGIRDSGQLGGEHPLIDRARRRSGRLQRLFVVLGLGFGVACWGVFQLVDPVQRDPLRLLAYGLLSSWLIVPTVLALSARRGRSRWLLWPGYFVITIGALFLAEVGAAGIPMPWRPLSELVPTVLVSLIFVLATGRRSMRGAAWFVAPLLMVLGIVLAAGWLIGYVYIHLETPFDWYAWGAVALVVAVPVAGGALIWVVGRFQRAKWLGEQTLLILQWWLVQALWWALLVSAPGPLGAFAGMLPYAILLVGLMVYLARRPPSEERPVRLLLLRTFGAPERSSRLLHDLTRQWRWIGSVDLITAPDLASETLEPDEFLDFIRGRLDRRFVLDADGLDRRLDRLDLRSDRDGRYRVNELMCSDDTWQLALERLAGDADVILIDLRAFDPEHPGVDHEVQRVVALQPLSRVVAILDASTDAQTLRESLDRAAAMAPPSSPLHTDLTPALRVIGWQSSRASADRLMAALCEAASAPR